MVIKSIQKVIKVGDSLAVTIPARDAKNAGITAGRDVKISVDSLTDIRSDKTKTIAVEYEAFKKQYAGTLKNLAKR